MHQYIFPFLGIIENKGIEVYAIKKNSLQSFSEISILFLSISLIVALIYYFYKTIATIKKKNVAYTRWHQTFIKLMLTKAEIYYRERQV